MTAGLSRRNLLAGAAAAAIVAAVPAMPIEALAVPAAPAAPLIPMWSVGTEDNWDWIPVAAPDEETARRYWVSETIGGIECEAVEEGEFEDEDGVCECEWCAGYRNASADRQAAWDGKNVKIGDQDWLEAELGADCSRCHATEIFIHDGARAVDGKTVCRECLTLADWEKIDPVRAAEIREELADG